MARSVLRDDLCGWDVPGPQLALDDDLDCGCAGPEDPDKPELLHEFVIRQRVRTFDEDGTPVFDWADLLLGRALVFETRTEFEQDAGFTLVVASLVMANTEMVEVPETCVAVEVGTGRVWRITASNVVAGRVELRLELIASE